MRTTKYLTVLLSFLVSIQAFPIEQSPCATLLSLGQVSQLDPALHTAFGGYHGEQSNLCGPTCLVNVIEGYTKKYSTLPPMVATPQALLDLLKRIANKPPRIPKGIVENGMNTLEVAKSLQSELASFGDVVLFESNTDEESVRTYSPKENPPGSVNRFDEVPQYVWKAGVDYQPVSRLSVVLDRLRHGWFAIAMIGQFSFNPRTDVDQTDSIPTTRFHFVNIGGFDTRSDGTVYLKIQDNQNANNPSVPYNFDLQAWELKMKKFDHPVIALRADEPPSSPVYEGPMEYRYRDAYHLNAIISLIWLKPPDRPAIM